MLQNGGNIACQLLQEDVQSIELVISDTTSHHMFMEKQSW
jgi:hypothetical protein